MLPCYSSQPRRDHLPEGALGKGQPGPPAVLLHTPDQPGPAHTSYHTDASQLCPSVGHRDLHCPVCLQTAIFPVQTNCGHRFCAVTRQSFHKFYFSYAHCESPCLISYWRHGSWLDAISCPLCRQKVSVLCRLFSESQSDRQEREVLGEITDYNKRYSGAPRRVTDYLCDMPMFLQLLARGLGTMGGLVWLFFFRVALCCVGTVVSFSSPALEAVSSSATPLESDPSLSGLLGVLDDVVVVILLLICVLNINQQMEPEGTHTAATHTTVLGNSL